MIQRIPIDIERNYITKGLDPDTLTALVKEDNYRIAEKIYCIANGIKEVNHFMEIVDRDDLRLHATIRIYPAFAGEAKLQASSVPFIRPRLRSTAHYILRCRLYTTRTYDDVFSIEHKTASTDKIYEMCNELEEYISKTYL